VCPARVTVPPNRACPRTPSFQEAENAWSRQEAENAQPRQEAENTQLEETENVLSDKIAENAQLSGYESREEHSALVTTLMVIRNRNRFNSRPDRQPILYPYFPHESSRQGLGFTRVGTISHLNGLRWWFRRRRQMSRSPPGPSLGGSSLLNSPPNSVRRSRSS